MNASFRDAGRDTGKAAGAISREQSVSTPGLWPETLVESPASEAPLPHQLRRHDDHDLDEDDGDDDVRPLLRQLRRHDDHDEERDDDDDDGDGTRPHLLRAVQVVERYGAGAEPVAGHAGEVFAGTVRRANRERADLTAVGAEAQSRRTPTSRVNAMPVP
jgi:hypothetical protein